MILVTLIMLLLLKIYPLLPSYSWQPLLLVLSDLASSQVLFSEDGFTEDVEGRVIDHSTILLKPLCHPSIWLEDWQSVSKQ